MADETKLVDALWIAPFVGEMGRVTLIPGETVAQVPANEARDSDHWKPVRKPRQLDVPEVSTPVETETTTEAEV